MNSDQTPTEQAGSHAESTVDLAHLLEQCRLDLQFTEELLQELESSSSTDTENDNASLRSANPGSNGADAIRRLTSHVEALSSLASRCDVQPVLQAMHQKLVRCLKLVPAQRQN